MTRCNPGREPFRRDRCCPVEVAQTLPYCREVRPMACSFWIYVGAHLDYAPKDRHFIDGWIITPTDTYERRALVEKLMAYAAKAGWPAPLVEAANALVLR